MIRNEFSEFFEAIFKLKKFPFAVKVEGTLQFTEMIVLVHLQRECEENDAFNVKRIRDMLKISQPAVSQTISALEEKGYITRSINPKDRRKFHLELTESGHNEVIVMRERVDAAWKEVMSHFTQEEIDTFIAFTDKLVDVSERVTEKHNYAKGMV